ncbi:MAG: acyltransferase [Rickettsiaceae bacterium]|jgi:esterase/lipase/1-acyl-sn-glycerol-3-phosphate acyltransferase|nr:acyltransferase [Rickettsiaceae bacterium]
MINQKTGSKTYRYTVLAMGLLEKLLGSKITVDGLENIPANPVLFVANHFTRSETFVVPYIIQKYTGRQVRCLADSGLFFGALGRFLKSVGAISTKDQKRDLTIISDLVSGDYDWMIYPEGSMVKNKEIRNHGKFISYSNEVNISEGLQNRVKTGSAVLALKSEIYRSDLIEAKRKQKTELLDYYKKEIGIEFSPNLKNLRTYIVPLNITYYPIRPGKNVIQKIVSKVFKKLPSQVSEELEIEGNLLLSSNINISFGEAIDVNDYVKSTKALIYQIPIIKNDTKVNMILKYLKYRLTNQFMNAVYTNTQINIDHLLAAVLHFYPEGQISVRHLKSLIYLSASHISSLKKYRLDSSLEEGELYKILDNDQEFEPFEGVVRLAKMCGIIQVSEDKKTYLINKSRLGQKYDFQQIRLENTLQVIFNEFLLLESAVNVVKRNILLGECEARQKSLRYILQKDLEIFNHDYASYYDPDLSKDKSVGAPSFLSHDGSEKDKSIGILLSHGYMSAPKEMEEMAKYFNNLGFKIYSVRLKGHGTAPANLNEVKWQDWYDSLNRGHVGLKLVCERVFLVGFSTGGLLSLVMASKKGDKIDGAVAINPALKLKDIRAKFAFGVHLWNDLLDKFNIKKGHLRYVENHSENPDINYSQNYINGVEQLELLMKNCESGLDKINCPVLIIQSHNDPVVDSKSSKILLQEIPPELRSFQEIDSQKHIIVRGEEGQKLSDQIKSFISNICQQKAENKI